MSDPAGYAANPLKSRGRKWPEPSDSSRNDFQRDRERIIHSTAFRRLEYKTQVFVNHEGDLFRTRLTHTIEVAQIARSIARLIGVNEDLTEAICLSHDLGHTPFGHSGQDQLNACMREYGGFEHNMQSLRVVDKLEERYGSFDGLNLTFESREGILKHCSKADASKLGKLGKRFLDGTSPSIEAQVANIADEIAYNNHDVDDGLRSELLQIDQLNQLSIFRRFFREVERSYPKLIGRRKVNETVRRIINSLINDLVLQTKRNIHSADPKSIEDVRNSRILVEFSPSLADEHKELKNFLRKNLYQHDSVLKMSNKSKRIVNSLFNLFTENTALLPKKFRVGEANEQPRRISDYVAGMTDRYAIKLYHQFIDSESEAI